MSFGQKKAPPKGTHWQCPGTLNTLSMINILRSSLPSVKQVSFADDSAGAGHAVLHDWYELLCKEGAKYVIMLMVGFRSGFSFSR